MAASHPFLVPVNAGDSLQRTLLQAWIVLILVSLIFKFLCMNILIPNAFLQRMILHLYLNISCSLYILFVTDVTILTIDSFCLPLRH